MKPCPEPVVGFHAQQEPTPGCWHWCWLRLCAEGHLAAAQAAVGTFGGTSWGLTLELVAANPASLVLVSGPGVLSSLGTVVLGAPRAQQQGSVALCRWEQRLPPAPGCCSSPRAAMLGGGRRSRHQNPSLSAAAESLPRLQSSHRAHPSESSPGSSFGCGANLVLSLGLLHLLQPWAAPRGCTKRWHGARSPPAPRQLPWQREW